MLRQAAESERQLTQLRKEIVDMKRLKVKLMNQLREEVAKSKAEEAKYVKQIALLKRDHLKKDNQIKNLEAEKRCREIVLKRKQEQIQALRNKSSTMSEKVSGRVAASAAANYTHMSLSLQLDPSSCTTNANFNAHTSSKEEKRKLLFQQRWTKIDASINSIIVKKQAIGVIEREMERYLTQREKISRRLNRLLRRLNKATLLIDIENESSRVDELKEQMDIIKSNIDYLNDQIAECQTNIIELGESNKKEGDYFQLENHLVGIGSLEEARFVLKKLLVLALNKGIVAAQKQHLNSELECELEQLERDYNVQQQLVQQIIDSGLITNDFARHILFDAGGTGTGANESSLFSGRDNENFEIDEILLAPCMDGNNILSNTGKVLLKLNRGDFQ